MLGGEGGAPGVHVAVAQRRGVPEADEQVSEQPVGRRAPLAGRAQAVGGVLADRLRQPVTRAVGDNERLVDKARERPERVHILAAHGAGGVEVEVAGEHRKPAKNGAIRSHQAGRGSKPSRRAGSRDGERRRGGCARAARNGRRALPRSGSG